jgi:hypothetical protein
MPITYHLKPNENLVLIVHVGIVPDDEFLSFYKKFYRDTIAGKSLNHLVDLRQAKSYERSTEALRKLPHLMQEHFSKLDIRPKVAVIAPDVLSFALARIFESHSSPIPFSFHVFKTVDKGLEWLDAPGSLLDDLDALTKDTNGKQ